MGERARASLAEWEQVKATARALATKLLDGLDADSIHKIPRGNAIDLFELQAFA